ncbi:thioesterase family protein [Sulfuritalea sp.]|uniref:acyl-CoA thioesterase n=1 Tax=Sulfuritalea sp. TaxID=2480090 RepID=UPI00286E46A2|nr:thioesterase family protein [Sulfuritalea sp.]
MHSTVEIMVSHRLRVRYAETDQMGVVYHANYIIWFHEARDALLREAGINLAAIESEGYRFPIIDASCRYLHSARYGDEVVVRARLLREKVARMRFRFEVRHARSLLLLATGASVSVMTNASGKLLLRTPPNLDRLLKELAAKQHNKNELEV